MSELIDRQGLIALGLPEEFSFGIRDRVRFGELDALNHVNNTVYLRWTENLRVQMLPKYDLSDFAAGDRNFVIRAQAMEFFAPMFLHQEYVMGGRFTKVGNSSLEMAYAVYCDGQVPCRITAQLVMIDVKSGRPARVPDAARAILRDLDGVE